MVKVIGVRFRNAGKIYYFDPLDIGYRSGQNDDCRNCERY